MTLDDLVTRFSDWTNTRTMAGKQRARHLREAGLISSGGRGRGGARMTACDCAHYLIGWLASDVSINAPEAVRFHSQLKPIELPGSDLAQTEPWDSFINRDTSFTTNVAVLIEAARYDLDPTNILHQVKSVTCGRPWPSSSIEYESPKNRILKQVFEMRPADARHKIAVAHYQRGAFDAQVPIQVSATLSSNILILLGEGLGAFPFPVPAFDQLLEDIETPRGGHV